MILTIFLLKSQETANVIIVQMLNCILMGVISYFYRLRPMRGYVTGLKSEKQVELKPYPTTVHLVDATFDFSKFVQVRVVSPQTLD